MFRLFNPLKNITKKSVKYPLSKEDMNQLFGQQDICPDCGMNIYEHMVLGPQGGGSTNIKCTYCGSFFNDMGPFGVDRIRWFNHHSIIKSTLLEIKNYTHFTPTIIQTWISVYVTPRISYEELYNWCKENCKENWSVKSGKLHDSRAFCDFDKTTFFFHPKDKNVAALFKLTFS